MTEPVPEVELFKMFSEMLRHVSFDDKEMQGAINEAWRSEAREKDHPHWALKKWNLIVKENR